MYHAGCMNEDHMPKVIHVHIYTLRERFCVSWLRRRWKCQLWAGDCINLRIIKKKKEEEVVVVVVVLVVVVVVVVAVVAAAAVVVIVVVVVVVVVVAVVVVVFVYAELIDSALSGCRTSMKLILYESGDAWRQGLLKRYVDGRATLSFLCPRRCTYVKNVSLRYENDITHEESVPKVPIVLYIYTYMCMIGVSSWFRSVLSER